jgi:hypothetical protein
MTRFTLLILILFSLITGSCSSRKNKLDRKGMIPEQDLTSIIKDIYIANGLLSLPEVHALYIPPDSLSTYKEVIGKYGYTKEAMDKTMKYYFIKKPKELVKIFDHVLGIFSAMDSRIEKELLLAESRAANLWKGKDFYLYPEPAGSDSTFFSIMIKPGVYTLTYTLTLFPDDYSVNPGLNAWYCRPDSIETGKRHWIKTINYVKDGHPHIYTNYITIPPKSFVLFRGWLYDFDEYPADFCRHLRIEKISLTNP